MKINPKYPIYSNINVGIKPTRTYYGFEKFKIGNCIIAKKWANDDREARNAQRSAHTYAQKTNKIFKSETKYIPIVGNCIVITRIK